MDIVFKVIIGIILILPLQGFAGILKKSNVAICFGLNHTGFDYINSAPFFSDKLHIGSSLGVAFKHHFLKYIGYSVGLDYCILGGKKYLKI